jgi:hypothetical protein
LAYNLVGSLTSTATVVIHVQPATDGSPLFIPSTIPVTVTEGEQFLKMLLGFIWLQPKAADCYNGARDIRCFQVPSLLLLLVVLIALELFTCISV